MPDPDLLIRPGGEKRISNFCHGNYLIQNLYLQTNIGQTLIEMI